MDKHRLSEAALAARLNGPAVMSIAGDEETTNAALALALEAIHSASHGGVAAASGNLPGMTWFFRRIVEDMWFWANLSESTLDRMATNLADVAMVIFRRDARTVAPPVIVVDAAPAPMRLLVQPLSSAACAPPISPSDHAAEGLAA